MLLTMNETKYILQYYFKCACNYSFRPLHMTLAIFKDTKMI